MSIKHVGMIAEDESDIEVLKELGRRISGRSFSTSHHVGKGCGPLKRKTPGWCKSLRIKGCQSVVLVHDRDDKNSAVLRGELEGILGNSDIARRYVVIPSEELEAWLLSDPAAIKSALNLETEPNQIHHPEAIPSPKEHLGRLVKAHSKNQGKCYINTEHNRLIAKTISISQIAKKCPSFGYFKTFIENEIGIIKTTPKPKTIRATPSATRKKRQQSK